MASKLPSHLMKSRHGIFYLRLTHAGKEKRKSLKTRDPFQAKLAAFELGYKMSLMSKQDQKIRFATLEELDSDAEYERIARTYSLKEQAYAEIQELKDKLDKEAYIQALLNESPELAIEYLKKQQQEKTATYADYPNLEPITIEAACDKYLESRKNQITIGANRTFKSCHNKLKKAFSGRQVSTITKNEISHIISNPIGGKSKATITKDAEEWYRLFEYLIGADHITKNPVIKPKFTRTQTARLRAEHGRERLEHDDDDILKLFSEEHINSLTRPEDVWLPFLSLSCGARLESLARLIVNDITETTIKLRAETDKNGNARVIPMHPFLKKAGFLIYVKEIEALYGNDSYIFTEMNEVEGRRSHYFSKSFGLKRKKLGIAKGKDFHAYRTTVVSRLDKDEVNARVRRLFVGHKVGEVLDVEDEYYNKSKWTTAEIADRVFQSLDYDEIPWTYTPNSAIKMINRIRKIKDQPELAATKAKEGEVNPKPISPEKRQKDRKKRLKVQAAAAEKRNKSTERLE